MLIHLLELRRRLLRVTIFFVLLLFFFFFFASNLFQAFVFPLLKVLSGQAPLIATQITTPLMIPLKLAADAALLLTAPYALLQIWLFASPGLYRKERTFFLGVVVASLLLFSAGVFFCFYGILPWLLKFMVNSVPAAVNFMPDITSAVDFITRMLLLFGLGFQVPVICLVLVYLGWLDVVTLKKIRPYMIVGSFILSMLIAPPDVLSQTLLAVPLCLLYELGIFLAVCFVRSGPESP